MPNPPDSSYSFAKVFGGVIAFVLLGLYAAIIGWLIWEVMVAGLAGEATANSLGEGAISVVTAIGGLVSALVVSKLALTKPGATPGLDEGTRRAAGARGIEQALHKIPATLTAKTMAVLYLSVWVTVGLAALVVGTVLFPGLNSTVDDIGTSWLGLAIAAGYAYFGLDPKR